MIRALSAAAAIVLLGGLAAADVTALSGVTAATASAATTAGVSLMPVRDPVPAYRVQSACEGYDKSRGVEWKSGYCAGYVAAAIQTGISMKAICLPASLDLEGAIKVANAEMGQHPNDVSTQTGLQVVIAALSMRYPCQG